MVINGACHCGNVSFTLDWLPAPNEIPARACGCSFCTKHGGVWTSDPSATLSVTMKDSSKVSRYAFGTRTATFHVCSHCGTVPFVTSEIDGQLYAVVNVNALENLDPSTIRRAAANFEDEDVVDRLARRTRNWIADVRIHDSEADSSSRTAHGQ
jgi:hypothetical protein